MIKPTESDYKCLQKSNRNTKEYSMTKTVSYNIKKVLAGTMLAALPFAFGGCEKDPVKPNNDNNNNQPKTYTYYYDAMGIPTDTVKAHTNVDSFFVVPIRTDLFATWPEQDVHGLRNHLQNCRNYNLKTYGKGDMELHYANSDDIAFLKSFGYNIKTR